MNVKEMSAKMLINEAVVLNHLIRVEKCYGVRDVQILDAILEEIERRGLKFNLEEE